MKWRLVAAGSLVAAVAFVVWRGAPYTVARPGVRPLPLAAREPADRRPTRFDVVLPSVPVGMTHLTAGGDVLLVHYWAPWQRHSRAQAAHLDSLRRSPGLEDLRVVVVCADPFPSVARFIARHRLRLSVALDPDRRLRRALPCPSIPYTVVLDAAGRVAVEQRGEVDWLAPATRQTLRRLLEEHGPAAEPLTEIVSARFNSTTSPMS